MGSIKTGFTFLELVVVIMLFGIMTTMVVPNLQYLLPTYKRKEFLTQISVLVHLTWQQSLATQKAHRVYFDLEKRILRIEIESDKKDKEGKPAFEPATITYLNTSYQWSDSIVIKQFFIEGEELLTHAGIKTDKVWFYIAPDGLAQEVVINLVDNGDLDAQGKPTPVGLVLNPFSAEFKIYDEFQKTA
jgi:prepilin-type N-terminal cleavage/methylation domain-containing protein